LSPVDETAIVVSLHGGEFMNPNLLVSIIAVVVSLASFSFAWAASARAARAEEIKNLLGEKETVGFGALKLLRDGLPGEFERAGIPKVDLLRRRLRLRDAKQRELVIGALIAACMFERSDRARALLYRVIEKYRDTPFNGEFRRQFVECKATIESMKTYNFTEEEFKSASAETRLGGVEKVLYHGAGGR
jgi:hypothetical protein